MAPLSLAFDHQAVYPGAEVEIALTLQGLAKTACDDASYIPPADHWRSNVAACVWDDLGIRFHGSVAVAQIIPFFDGADSLSLRCHLDRRDDWRTVEIVAELWSDDGCLAREEIAADGDTGEVSLDVSKCPWWSPGQPSCMQLRILIQRDGEILDIVKQTWGRRNFSVKGKGFELNGEPIHLRAGSIVWHRWIRNEKGRELGWDREWLRESVVRRLKRHGANTLRFHLGMPPQFLLDMCDEEGLVGSSGVEFFSWHEC